MLIKIKQIILSVWKHFQNNLTRIVRLEHLKQQILFVKWGISHKLFLKNQKSIRKGIFWKLVAFMLTCWHSMLHWVSVHWLIPNFERYFAIKNPIQWIYCWDNTKELTKDTQIERYDNRKRRFAVVYSEVYGRISFNYCPMLS